MKACQWLIYNSVPNFLVASSVLFRVRLGKNTEILAKGGDGRRNFRKANARNPFKKDLSLSFWSPECLESWSIYLYLRVTRMEGIVLISRVCVQKFMRVEVSTKDSTSGPRAQIIRRVLWGHRVQHSPSVQATLTICRAHLTSAWIPPAVWDLITPKRTDTWFALGDNTSC